MGRGTSTAKAISSKYGLSPRRYWQFPLFWNAEWNGKCYKFTNLVILCHNSMSRNFGRYLIIFTLPQYSPILNPLPSVIQHTPKIKNLTAWKVDKRKLQNNIAFGNKHCSDESFNCTDTFWCAVIIPGKPYHGTIVRWLVTFQRIHLKTKEMKMADQGRTRRNRHKLNNKGMPNERKLKLLLVFIFICSYITDYYTQ